MKSLWNPSSNACRRHSGAVPVGGTEDHRLSRARRSGPRGCSWFFSLVLIIRIRFKYWIYIYMDIYPLVNCHIAMERSTHFIANGKPSISISHRKTMAMLHNQRVIHPYTSYLSTSSHLFFCPKFPRTFHTKPLTVPPFRHVFSHFDGPSLWGRGVFITPRRAAIMAMRTTRRSSVEYQGAFCTLW